AINNIVEVKAKTNGGSVNTVVVGNELAVQKVNIKSDIPTSAPVTVTPKVPVPAASSAQMSTLTNQVAQVSSYMALANLSSINANKSTMAVGNGGGTSGSSNILSLAGAASFGGNVAGAIAVNTNDFSGASLTKKGLNTFLDIILPTTTETSEAQRLLNKAASLGGQGVKLYTGELVPINTVRTASTVGKVGQVLGVAGTIITPFTEIGTSADLFKDDLALVAQYNPENYNKALVLAIIGTTADASSFGFARSLANTVPSLAQLAPGEDPQWTKDWIDTVNRKVNTKNMIGK
ncbi:hypothetical protein, partial [Ruminiclostridium hungatei]